MTNGNRQVVRLHQLARVAAGAAGACNLGVFVHLYIGNDFWAGVLLAMGVICMVRAFAPSAASSQLPTWHLHEASQTWAIVDSDGIVLRLENTNYQPRGEHDDQEAAIPAVTTEEDQ